MTVTEVMKEAETHFDAPLTYPRGMINTGNMCFANAILQVLVYCAPFYNLFKLLGEVVPHDFHNSTPLMEAVIQFLSEFKLIPAEARHNDNGNAALAADILLDLQATSEPFVPDSLYDAMKLTKRFDAMRRGHQEDAEEFLGFFLDTLHEELQLTMQKSVARQRTNSQETPDNLVVEDGSVEAYADEDGLELGTERRELDRPASPTEGDGWLEVGQKGKTSFTRTTSTAHSPITRIFGGKLRSVLRTPGSKDSVTLEPYQPLQLDIQPPHVSTIEDALENLTRPETISGVLSSTKKLVDATKQVFIETLPPVLVVHLKRFYYDDVGGVQKSTKSLTFGPTLEVAESVISTPRRAETKRKYNLFGVVYHHGRYANGGHYTVDVLRQDRSEWLHIDDTVWATTSAPQARATKHISMNNSAAAAIANAAIKPASPKVANGQMASSMSDAGSTSAYLLFYTRADDTEQRGQDMKGISPPISAKKMVEMAASAAANKTNIVPGAPVQARKAGADMTTSKDLRKNPSVPSSPQTARSK
jgi:ubiquitin carboxyl-terminal hydrolase 10